jgi:TolA-binding protein
LASTQTITPAAVVEISTAPAPAPVAVSSAPAAAPVVQEAAPKSASELMGWFGHWQELVGKSSGPSEEKSDLQKAVQFILDGDLETGRQGFAAFKKTHPDSLYISDIIQAEANLKLLEKAEQSE